MILDISLGLESERSTALPFVWLAIVFLLALPQTVSLKELTLYRLAHYEALGSLYGSPTTLIDMELATVNSTTNLARKCLIAPLEILGINLFTELVERNIGAMVVMIPDELSKLGIHARDRWLELETQLLTPDVPIPVYFAPSEQHQWRQVYEGVKANELIHASPFSFGYLRFVSTQYNHALRTVSTQGVQSPALLKNVTLLNLQGSLGGENKNPTITLSANIDTFCSSPLQCYGYRACGGVASLLAIASLFSRLYADEQSRPDYNILFLLTLGGGSNLNFISLKKAIESPEKLKTSYLHVHSKFSISLDDLGGERLYAHFVKTPNEGTFGASFVNRLEANMKIGVVSEDREVSVVTRKVNKLSFDNQAWPHEQFYLSRVVGTTLSSNSEADSPLSHSVLDREGGYSEDYLYENTQAIAETLAQIIFNSKQDNITYLKGTHSIDRSYLKAIHKFIYKYPRPIQALGSHNVLIKTLKDWLSAASTEFDFAKIEINTREDGSYEFYDELQLITEVSKVKPPIFDLMLFLVVLLYLGVIGGCMYWVREWVNKRKRKEKYN
ncbi:hypothetical protein LOD99_5013 [Oopsacas minuta]|uniref:Nicalin n=1 Tax=Oopsacas minuta TaxID=111878 RepID=A0AAV7JST2_9METZ|nr:hypothetical protein LOD99_5013 [Oopsacas minuta]